MDLNELLGAMRALSATTSKPRPVHIPGLGDVHIREVTVGEIDDQVADTADGKNKRGVARGACRLLADPQGKRLLDPDNPEHVAEMAKLPMRVLVAINAESEKALGPASGN